MSAFETGTGAVGPTGPTGPGGDLGAWAAWSPALTGSGGNPTLGTGGTSVGRWLQIGDLVIATFKIDFGSSGESAGSGDYRVSLPTALSSSIPNYDVIGHGRIYDANVNTHRLISILKDATETTRAVFVADAVAGVVTASSPWTWAATDTLNGTMIYEAA